LKHSIDKAIFSEGDWELYLEDEAFIQQMHWLQMDFGAWHGG